jgi:hypothetical protein
MHQWLACANARCDVKDRPLFVLCRFPAALASASHMRLSAKRLHLMHCGLAFGRAWAWGYLALAFYVVFKGCLDGLLQRIHKARG